jgi:hypothetical protein
VNQEDDYGDDEFRSSIPSADCRNAFHRDYGPHGVLPECFVLPHSHTYRNANNHLELHAGPEEACTRCAALKAQLPRMSEAEAASFLARNRREPLVSDPEPLAEFDGARVQPTQSDAMLMAAMLQLEPAAPLPRCDEHSIVECRQCFAAALPAAQPGPPYICVRCHFDCTEHRLLPQSLPRALPPGGALIPRQPAKP